MARDLESIDVRKSIHRTNLKIQLSGEIIINDPVLIYSIRMKIKAMRIWA